MTTSGYFSMAPHQSEIFTFEPTQHARLERLEKFASRTGAHYAGQRNYDFVSGDRGSVSALSPWIKHRLIRDMPKSW